MGAHAAMNLTWPFLLAEGCMIYIQINPMPLRNERPHLRSPPPIQTCGQYQSSVLLGGAWSLWHSGSSAGTPQPADPN